MSAVCWDGLSAEEALAALDTRPVILGVWMPWGFSRGSSRHECHPWRDGARQCVSVQPSDDEWMVTGLGKYGTYLTAASEQEAKDLADHLSRGRGWKLMGAVPPISEDTK